MFFDSWGSLGRILVVGVLAYVALVVLLRISGNRTLTKLNAFDLVVTVALGSTLATILLSSEVSLTEGILALALLVGLQYAVTWSSVRFPRLDRWVKSEPALLAHRGTLLESAMRRGRVTEDEILAVLRARGMGDVSEADAIVLESDGSISVLPRGAHDSPALENVTRRARPN